MQHVPPQRYSPPLHSTVDEPLVCRRRRREYCLKIYYRTLMPLSYFNMLHKLSEGSFFFLIVSIIGHKILTFSVSPRDGDLLRTAARYMYIRYRIRVCIIIYYIMYLPDTHPRATSWYLYAYMYNILVCIYLHGMYYVMIYGIVVL